MNSYYFKAMKRTIHRIRIAAIVAAAGAALPPLSGQVLVQIDMDRSTAAIESMIAASVGDQVHAAIVFDLSGAADGVSSYGVSLEFDTGELSLDTSPAGSEMLPAGFAFNISPGVASEIEDAGGGRGRVLTYEAATFGVGPTTGTFVAGHIDFVVDSVLDDGLPDVVPGLFNGGVDGIFNNASAPADVNYEAGYVVVPEPEAYTLAAALGALSVAAWRRRPRRR